MDIVEVLQFLKAAELFQERHQPAVFPPDVGVDIFPKNAHECALPHCLALAFKADAHQPLRKPPSFSGRPS